MIELIDVNKFYPNKKVIQNLSLTLSQNIINVIIGPSGSGKTTFLELLSNPSSVSSGEVRVSSELSYVFQEPRLIPHKTVEGNIDFVLRGIMPNREMRHAKINEILRLVELEGANELYPRELSGGMAQRLAIARAFAFPSKVLLMDEAFKSLDLKLKRNILHSFLRLWQLDKRTVVCVTHDIDEALLIADRIYLFSKSFELIKKFDVCCGQDRLKRDIITPEFVSLKSDIFNLMED